MDPLGSGPDRGCRKKSCRASGRGSLAASGGGLAGVVYWVPRPGNLVSAIIIKVLRAPPVCLRGRLQPTGLSRPLVSSVTTSISRRGEARSFDDARRVGKRARPHLLVMAGPAPRLGAGRSPPGSASGPAGPAATAPSATKPRGSFGCGWPRPHLGREDPRLGSAAGREGPRLSQEGEAVLLGWVPSLSQPGGASIAPARPQLWPG